MDEQILMIREKFEKYKQKRIVVYGTGKNAVRFLEACWDFNIVALTDRYRCGGSIKGKHIIAWNCLDMERVDMIVIASMPCYYHEIYERIADKCMIYGIVILDLTGQNLNRYFGVPDFSVYNIDYYKKNVDELKQKILKYDIVGFELFDILLMYKTLEPVDVFWMLEKRLEEKGLYNKDFKKLRIEAEIAPERKDIDKIYDELQGDMGIDSLEIQRIKQEELDTRKDFLAVRKSMVEIMRFAKWEGKTVFIIADTCLTKQRVINILKELAIDEYDEIIISNEYKIRKGILWHQDYLKRIASQRYLYVGKRAIEGVGDTERSGRVDSYLVKSAYEMAQISNLRRYLVYANNMSERNLLGLIISEVFNDPFALYNTYGKIGIASLSMYAKLLIAPLAVLYMQELIGVLEENQDYSAVLFLARDGYLFERLYRKLYETGQIDKFGNPGNIPGIYFMASRKLCLKAVTKEENDILFLKEYFRGKTEEYIKKFWEIPKKRQGDISDVIFTKAHETEKNYRKYMNKNDINPNKKYLLCDLCTAGTIQYALSRMCGKEQDLFALGMGKRKCGIGMKAYVVYKWDQNASFNIVRGVNLLEIVFSAPHPSVLDMDADGKPVFMKETRTLKKIAMMKQMQESIEDFFTVYIEKFYVKGQKIRNELPDRLFKLCWEVDYVGECKQIQDMTLYDEINDNKLKLFSPPIP